MSVRSFLGRTAILVAVMFAVGLCVNASGAGGGGHGGGGPGGGGVRGGGGMPMGSMSGHPGPGPGPRPGPGPGPHPGPRPGPYYYPGPLYWGSDWPWYSGSKWPLDDGRYYSAPTDYDFYRWYGARIQAADFVNRAVFALNGMPVEKIRELTSPDLSSQYYSAARTAFRQGNYRNAIRLASHAAVESSHKVQIHELLSLALFASGEYEDASSAAHAVLAKGAVADWNLLFGYYGDVDRYTEQLRTLERYTLEHPDSAAGRFLLGYHYLMIGEPEKAREEFAQTVKLAPDDKLAKRYLEQLQPNLEQLQPEVLPAFPPPSMERIEPQGVVL